MKNSFNTTFLFIAIVISSLVFSSHSLAETLSTRILGDFSGNLISRNVLPDGKSVALIYRDTRNPGQIATIGISLYDLETGKPGRWFFWEALDQLTPWQVGIGFIPETSLVYLTMGDNIKLINLLDGSTVRETQIQRSSSPGNLSLTFTKDLSRAYYRSTKDFNYLDMSSGKVVRLFSIKGSNSQEVTQVSLSPDGQAVAMLVSDSKISIWDVASDNNIIVNQLLSNTKIYKIHFGPDSESLLAESYDKGFGPQEILFFPKWRMSNYGVVRKITIPQGLMAHEFLSPSLIRMVFRSGSLDWNWETNVVERQLEFSNKQSNFTIHKYFPELKLALVSDYKNKTFSLYDLISLSPVMTFPQHIFFSGFSGELATVVASTSSFVFTGEFGTFVFDGQGRRPPRALGISYGEVSDENISEASLNSKEKLLLTEKNLTTTLWNYESGQRLALLPAFKAIFSKDGKLIYAVSDFEDLDPISTYGKSISVFSALDGSRVKHFTFPKDTKISRLSWTADGTSLISNYWGDELEIDPVSGEIKSIFSLFMSASEISLDHQFRYIVGPNSSKKSHVRKLQYKTENVIWSQDLGETSANNIRLSPDGTRIFVFNGSGAILDEDTGDVLCRIPGLKLISGQGGLGYSPIQESVWNLKTCAPLLTLPIQTFSPSERYATVSIPSQRWKIAVVELVTGRTLIEFAGEFRLEAVFSEDEEFLFASDVNNWVHIWKRSW